MRAYSALAGREADVAEVMSQSGACLRVNIADGSITATLKP